MIEAYINILYMQHAQERGVRILVDAEQTYLQPAIRHITTNHLMPKFNVHQSVIFNTIQGYLKVTTLMIMHPYMYVYTM